LKPEESCWFVKHRRSPLDFTGIAWFKVHDLRCMTVTIIKQNIDKYKFVFYFEA